MPRIPEYQRQVSAPGPGAGPRMSGASPIAEAVKGFGRAVGNIGDAVYQRKVQRDLSNLDAKVASATADLTIQLKQQAQNADPNDDKFAENFINQTFDEQMKAIREQATTREGQQFYERNYANMRRQFMVNASDYQTELAATAAKDNYVTALNSRSTAAEQDPSNFETLLQQNAASLSVMSHLDTKSKIELRRAGDRDIAVAAAKGWIDLNPLMAKQVIEGGKYDKYISGEEKSQLLSQADAQMRLQDAELKRAQAEAKQAAKQASEDKFQSMLPDIVNGKVSLLDIAKDPVMDKADKDTAKAWVQAATSPERNKIRTNPSVYLNLWNRIHLPADDPNRLTDVTTLDKYVGNGSLALNDAKDLRAEMIGGPQGKIDAEIKKQWQKAATSVLSGTNQLLGLRDPKGDEQMVAYMSWALPKLEEGKAAGKSLAQMLAPDGEIFSALNNYRRSPSQMIADIISDNPNNPNLDTVLAQGTPAKVVPEFKSKEEVAQAYRDGKISRDQAIQVLKDKGWGR